MRADPRIVVLDDWERSAEAYADWSALRARAEVVVHHEPLRGAALTDAVAEADALVLMRDRTPLDAALLAKMPRLSHVTFTGTRNNAIDLAALTARRIPVAGTAWGPSKAATCELTWALTLAAVRRVEQGFASMRAEGGWREGLQGRALPDVLEGRRLGLVGLGAIGARVAAVGRAFGMDVVAWSPNLTAERAAAGGATHVPLDELLATSDVVSLHLVLAPATRGLIDAARLAAMKAGAVLVNTSRAGLVDEQALRAALAAGRPAAAALDVYDVEPLPAGHWMRAEPRLVLSPHLGFVARPVFEAFWRGAVANLAAWLDGAPLDVLNPEALAAG